MTKIKGPNSIFAALTAAALVTALPFTAQAQSVVLGAGYSDFNADGSDDSVFFSVDYLHSPFFERGNFAATFGATVAAHSGGDAFIGAGVAGRFDLNNNWFVETSVMPGAFFENENGNDLGSTFEIRSLLGLGRELRNGTAVSLAISHKSNASTAARNPGVNSVQLRWHKPL